MKTSIPHITTIVAFLFIISACENPLEEETFSTLGESNYYQTAEDAERLLMGVYAQLIYSNIARDNLVFEEMTTDVLIERGGGINANTQPIEDFIWPTDHNYLRNQWTRWYEAIYRANVILDRVPDVDMNETRKEEMLAEARFLRALHYFWLNNWWGPVPLVLSSDTSVEDRPTRPSEDEFVSFLEDEFRTVSDILPDTPPQDQYGRATRGAALGFLTKFYLMNKKWTETAATAQQIIDSNQYSIFEGESRTDLFALENEENSEFIFVSVFPNNPTNLVGNSYLSHAAPPGYQWQYSNKVNFAAQFKIRSEFLELFEPGDERRDAFVFEYVNQAGEAVQLGEDDVRSFKYPEDPNSIGSRDGNDWPWLRYADILLSRAEALNELNGPNQESIQLINEIRTAAGVSEISINDFSNQQALRHFILDERGREFHTEPIRRQDLIRHGKFIEMAISRGKPADDHMIRFPIPQTEIDRNPNLEQNPGY